MNCDRVLSKWDAYWDGDVSSEEQLEIQRHLDSCAGCQKKLDGKAGLLVNLRRVPLPYSPPILLVHQTRIQARRWVAMVATIMIFLMGGVAGYMMGAWHPVKPAFIASPDHFPYAVTVTNDGPAFLIENEEDEREWQRFKRQYRARMEQIEEKHRLNRFYQENIPVQLIHDSGF